tara:strand:+ start:1115 stop:1507 length:393 start_codon:yes stop_codon:yes gene_type:complete
MTVVWTNGCFDILHVGHLAMLEYAKSRGHFLVVGVDADSRVSNSKGETRPYNTLENRMRMLNALECVDEVVSYKSDEELCLHVEYWKIDLMVVGEEYAEKVVVGSETAEIDFFPRVASHSSTEAINALRI